MTPKNDSKDDNGNEPTKEKNNHREKQSEENQFNNKEGNNIEGSSED